ncbi:hypothetical protein BH09PLA1_BH09PLA1_25520 [soil metagenome]
MIGSSSRKLAQITLMMAAICVFSAGAFAQTQRGNRGQGRQMVRAAMLERLHTSVNDLKLTDEQKPKIDEIFVTAKDELQKLQAENQDLPPQERAGKVREFTQQLHEKINTVLNDEQKAEFDKKLSEMRGQGQGQGQGQAGGQGGQIRRMRDAVESVGLSDEQKPKVDEILKDMEEKVQQARQESQGDPEAMREKGRAIAQNVVLQLEQVFTPEQQQKFRESMQANRGQGRNGQNQNGQGRAARRDGQQPGAGPATKPADGMNPPATQPAKDSKEGAMLPPGAAPDSPPDKLAGAPPGAPSRLEVGQIAPDFQIKKLDGSPVQLSSFKGKIVLLAFGSFTSPSFRQRAAALDELRREYGARVSFFVVYTREAHPAEAWEVERNRDDEISMADHKDEPERRTVARAAQNKLRLGQLTFTTDAMSNATADAYHAFPNNAAVLIGKDGSIAAYQQWFDAYAMRAAILETLGAKPQPDSTR